MEWTDRKEQSISEGLICVRYCALGKFISSHLISILPSILCVDVIVSISQMRKLTLREIKCLSQGDRVVNGTINF